ncbi:FtsW/RodA/SpoVE family cell cycle protein [Elusimicrobiota bacterium]
MKKNIENFILMLIIILGSIGIIMVYSSTVNSPEMDNIYIKQMIAFFVGFACILIMRKFSYKVLEELSILFYIISVMLLIGLHFAGIEINGSKRWYDLGLFYFQPVEFAKPAVILFLALLLEKYDRMMFAFVTVIIVVILVLIQPDAGSSFLFFPVLVMMLYVSRVNTRWITFIIPFMCIIVLTLFAESYLNVRSSTIINIKYLVYPLIVTVIIYFLFKEVSSIDKNIRIKHFILITVMLWCSIGTGIVGSRVLRGYQKKRIISFLMPELDPLGAGYNIRQSLMAVGSGKIFGKGLFSGTQTQLGFLPVRHNDFIFATIAEELGLLGSVAVLLLLVLLLWQIIRIMEITDELGGRLIAAGIFSLIFSQVILNIGVTLGLLPVIGIQLPFISYGGTGLVSFMIMIGILLNINRKTGIIGK